MFCGIAGCSVVSQWFIGMIGCPVVRLFCGIAVCSVVRDGQWDSKMFCYQLVVYWDDRMISGLEMFFGIAGCSDVRDVLWDSRMFCGQRWSLG